MPPQPRVYAGLRAMRKSLLPYLACPSCKSGLSLHASKESGGHAVEGALRCVSCGASYPISGGVPRLLCGERSGVEKRTSEVFGYEWRKFHDHYPAFREQFLDWIHPIREDFFEDKAVLDAGCGMGRHLTLSAQFGARDAIGIDASPAADVAYAHTRALPNAHVIQGDICNPPLKPAFDYVYSIGVLHHLPQPREGFRRLAGLLRNGGTLSIWVYGREHNAFAVRIITPFRERLFSALPRRAQYVLSLAITATIFPIMKTYRLIGRFAPGAVPRLPFGVYFLYLSAFPFKLNWSNVFDHLSVPISFYHRRAEVEEWFKSEGFRDVAITPRNNNSWRGRGRKPADL